MKAVRWSVKGKMDALMAKLRPGTTLSHTARPFSTSVIATATLVAGLAVFASLPLASITPAEAQTTTASADKPRKTSGSQNSARQRKTPSKNTVTAVRPKQTGNSNRNTAAAAPAAPATALVPIPAALPAPALPSAAIAPAVVTGIAAGVAGGVAAGTLSADRPPAAASPVVSEVLQFGVFNKEMDAWLGWKNIVRRQPDMVADLVPKVVPLRASAPEDGYVLLAVPMPDLEPRYVCRRITSSGGSCMVVERADLGELENGPSGIPDADQQGVVTYTTEQSREMVEIERHASRLSTMSTIIPGSTLKIDIGALKANRWNLCALTFDDGPHVSVTPRILDVLRAEKVRATFFPIANVGRRYPAIIERIVQEGHELANHSVTHPNMRNMAPEAQRAEVAEANRVLALAGSDPVLFRPPFGRYNHDTLNILEQEGMTPVLWNVDTRDWQSRNREKIVAQVREAAAIGSVVLMHMTYAATAEALPESIAILRSRGCRFVTVSEWIASLDSLAQPHIAQR